MTTAHHQILIVGGGTAGISVAARLIRKGYTDVAVIEPSTKHYYQPLWTLVGGGCAKASTSEHTESSVMPKDASWIRSAATGFRPDDNIVDCENGSSYEYDVLVVCPGIQLDWDKIPGVTDTLGRDGVSSNYTYELAPKTWNIIRNTTSGTAVFGMPSGPIKCAGAPQKIAYLACDHWRNEGVLDDIDVHLVLPTPRTFGVTVFADALDEVVKDYGIHLHLQTEIESVDPDGRTVTTKSLGDAGSATTLPYDLLHVVPHQSAPDWVKSSPLSTGEGPGYVSIDKNSMQHTSHLNVFSLGDAGSSPNSKTGAAIRKQAPVVAENVDAFIKNQALGGEYLGYSSCPLTTSRSKMLLAEFDYTMQPTPSIPLIDTTKPRRDMWFLKKYGLPFMYWNLMLKGSA